MNNLTSIDYKELLNSNDIRKAKLEFLIGQIIELSTVLEGNGAPNFQANKHAWYFDTASNKYYRNTGGTNWVSLN